MTENIDIFKLVSESPENSGVKMNIFAKDVEYADDEKDDKILNAFYQKYFGKELCEIKAFPYKLYPELQLKGLDKILYLKNGREIKVDEKKRREFYPDIAIEIFHDEKNKVPGWLFKPLADYIAYAKMPIKKIYFLPLPLLRLWVEKDWDYVKTCKPIRAHNPTYTTLSYAIPDDVLLNGLKEIMQQGL